MGLARETFAGTGRVDIPSAWCRAPTVPGLGVPARVLRRQRKSSPVPHLSSLHGRASIGSCTCSGDSERGAPWASRTVAVIALRSFRCSILRTGRALVR